MPALVPGMVDAGLVALREFGTKSFNEAIAPAIELADGFAIDEMRADIDRRISAGFSISGRPRKRTSCPTASSRGSGEIFRQPDLARTLRAMAEAEKKALAAGASRAGRQSTRCAIISIAAKSRTRSTRSCKANGGLLRYDDMAAFKLEAEEPVSTTYPRLYKFTSPASGARVPP